MLRTLEIVSRISCGRAGGHLAVPTLTSRKGAKAQSWNCWKFEPSVLPLRHPRAKLLPSHRRLVRAVSDCQRFCEAAGIGVVLAAGMRLSSSFARPPPHLARKSRPLDRSPWAAAGCQERGTQTVLLRFRPVRPVPSARHEMPGHAATERRRPVRAVLSKYPPFSGWRASADPLEERW